MRLNAAQDAGAEGAAAGADVARAPEGAGAGAPRVPGSEPALIGSALRLGSSVGGGRLSLLRRIGEGGMGVVYEAFDDERKAKVALKTLNRLDAASVYGLKNEFRALAGVVHPNLVRLHELFAEGDSWFFTMELVPGERFDRWVRPEPAARVLDEGRLRAAFAQLVDAVNAIHAAGKLHRDSEAQQRAGHRRGAGGGARFRAGRDAGAGRGRAHPGR